MIARLSRDRLFRLGVAEATRTGRMRATRAHLSMVRDQAKLEGPFSRRLVILFRELGERVADTYLSVERPIIEAVRPADLNNLVEHILASSRLNEWASSRLAPSFRDYWGVVLNATRKALQRSGELTDERGASAQRIMDMGGRRMGLVDITGHTREALFRALDQAREEGLNPRETARLIRDFIPEGRFVNAGPAYRAQLIARTETLHAQRMSSLEQYRSMVDVKHVMAFDGDGDEECAARDGQVFTLDDAEVEAMTEHPNGTLAFGPIAA